MRTTAFLLAFFALSGCVSSAERAARLAAADEAKCVSYGFATGTPAHGQCRMEQDRLRAAAQPQIVVVR